MSPETSRPRGLLSCQDPKRIPVTGITPGCQSRVFVLWQDTASVLTSARALVTEIGITSG